VNVDGLKVTVRFSKRPGAARVEKSWQTRRKLGRSSCSTCASRFSRQLSLSQNLRKAELVERTRLQIELLERVASLSQS